MTKRNIALWDNSSPALTPMYLETVKPSIGVLQTILRSERRMHARTIAAFTRYVELLERQIASQREAFEQLDKPLIPAATATRRVKR